MREENNNLHPTILCYYQEPIRKPFSRYWGQLQLLNGMKYFLDAAAYFEKREIEKVFVYGVVRCVLIKLLCQMFAPVHPAALHEPRQQPVACGAGRDGVPGPHAGLPHPLLLWLPLRPAQVSMWHCSFTTLACLMLK